MYFLRTSICCWYVVAQLSRSLFWSKVQHTACFIHFGISWCLYRVPKTILAIFVSHLSRTLSRRWQSLPSRVLLKEARLTYQSCLPLILPASSVVLLRRCRWLGVVFILLHDAAALLSTQQHYASLGGSHSTVPSICSLSGHLNGQVVCQGPVQVSNKRWKRPQRSRPNTSLLLLITCLCRPERLCHYQKGLFQPSIIHATSRNPFWPARNAVPC